jgi:hypothetical protein
MVQGSTDGEVVCCTLIRHGINVPDGQKNYETISTETRFAKATAGKWNALFHVAKKGKYLVICHSRTARGDSSDTNDYVEVVVSDVQDVQRIPPLIDIVGIEYGPSFIKIMGTVQIPNSITNVLFASTPCDPPVPPKPNVTQPPRTGYNVNTSYDSSGENWTVDLTPTPPGSVFSGCFTIVIEAPEGMASVTVGPISE